MEKTILRSQVYKEVLNGDPFDMIWITADRRRGTGGSIISAEGWMVISERNFSADASGSNMGGGANRSEITKDPNHPENGTVNVFNPANSGYHPISVHWDLIQFFNGKRVIN